MKRLILLFLALTLLLFSSSCKDKGTVSSDIPSESDSSAVTSSVEYIDGEWWNKERLNDWGLKKLEKPESEGATYVEYEENARIKLVLQCESLDYATEYAKYVFGYISKNFDTVYKGAAGKRDGKAESFDNTTVMDFSTYKLYSMLYDYNGATVWLTVTGDLNDDGSVGMIFFVSKALG